MPQLQVAVLLAGLTIASHVFRNCIPVFALYLLRDTFLSQWYTPLTTATSLSVYNIPAAVGAAIAGIVFAMRGFSNVDVEQPVLSQHEHEGVSDLDCGESLGNDSPRRVCGKMESNGQGQATPRLPIFNTSQSHCTSPDFTSPLITSPQCTSPVSVSSTAASPSHDQCREAKEDWSNKQPYRLTPVYEQEFRVDGPPHIQGRVRDELVDNINGLPDGGWYERDKTRSGLTSPAYTDFTSLTPPSDPLPLINPTDALTQATDHLPQPLRNSTAKLAISAPGSSQLPHSFLPLLSPFVPFVGIAVVMELIGSVLYTAGVGAGFKWLMFLGSAVAGLGAGGTVVLQRALIGCSLNEISEDNDLAELTHLASGSPEHLASGHPSLSTHSSPSNRSPRSLTSSAGLRPRINALDMTTTGMSIAVVIASVAKMFSKIEPAVLMHLFTSQWMRQIAQDEHPGAAHPPHNHLIHLEGTKRSESGLSGPTISFLSASLISSISHPQTLLESIKERASIYFASMLTYDHMCLTFVLLITILIANVASLYCAVNLKWIAWGGGAPETARALATVSSVTNVAPTPLAIQQRGLPLLLIPNHTTESDTQQRGTPTSLTPWPHHIRFNMAGGLLTPAPSDSGEQTHPLQSSGLASSPRGVISAAMALPGMASLLLVGNTMLRPIFSKVRQLLHYLSLQTHPDSPSASRTQSPRERLSRSFSSPLSLSCHFSCGVQNRVPSFQLVLFYHHAHCLDSPSPCRRPP
eukprot:GHVN01068636.1.p1 GENE.GHVN01068636.1~~GHVN01068636.1.p1  ORF type:complete len:749 (-),score=126.71 GHVN01068636.1:1635-3881(-)